uniref:Uncharacterized protein n=1 Tax=Populus trichocarpa TaxID=3694 RepID=A0A2K1XWU8_POPTR
MASSWYLEKVIFDGYNIYWIDIKYCGIHVESLKNSQKSVGHEYGALELLLSSTLSNHHPSISSSQPHTSVTEFTFFFPLSPFLFSCFLSFSSKLCLP